MSPKDLDKLIEKYLAGTCDDEERKYIEDWYASMGWPAGHHATRPTEEKLAPVEDRILSHLSSHAGQTHEAERKPLRLVRLWTYSGIAACILLLVAASLYFLPGEEGSLPTAPQASSTEFTTVTNDTRLARRIILPDGSLVQMSPQSKVRFATVPSQGERELFLDGDAFFDIAHDPGRPFYVYAGNVVTEVLGTSFRVRARGDGEKVTVTVKTGKVTVYTRKASHKKTVLTPNQEAVYDRSTELVAALTVPAGRMNEASEQATEMHFEETPVSEVLATLMQAYDVSILYRKEDLSACVLTSTFYEEGLYDRIDVICTAIGATYRIVDSKIVIESKGCNLKTE